jgi:hypothetical protein
VTFRTKRLRRPSKPVVHVSGHLTVDTTKHQMFCWSQQIINSRDTASQAYALIRYHSKRSSVGLCMEGAQLKYGMSSRMSYYTLPSVYRDSCRVATSNKPCLQPCKCSSTHQSIILQFLSTQCDILTEDNVVKSSVNKLVTRFDNVVFSEYVVRSSRDNLATRFF